MGVHLFYIDLNQITDFESKSQLEIIYRINYIYIKNLDAR